MPKIKQRVPFEQRTHAQPQRPAPDKGANVQPQGPARPRPAAGARTSGKGPAANRGA